jgi:hypothetical protein
MPKICTSLISLSIKKHEKIISIRTSKDVQYQKIGVSLRNDDLITTESVLKFNIE